MPIGLLIGWLIGQFICGVSIVHHNQIRHSDVHSLTLARSIARMFGVLLVWTSFFAFVGTMIELIVR